MLLKTFPIRLAAAWFFLLLVLKFYLAAQLELYHDEAFYWQASQQLALAYADHPFMTALLVRLGTDLAGNSTFGVRLLFLVMGSLFPFGVYLLARSRCSQQQALIAASFALFMPFTATLGLIAMPDVPLLFFAVFGLVAFEKATRTNSLSAWLATGLLAALGLSTHYRFILFPAAAFIYLISTTNGRSQWNKGRFWLAIMIMLCGLLPVLIFNLDNQFEALNYQFSERQAWLFQPKGLRHLLEQAIVVTPLLYIALVSVLIIGIKKAIRGDDRTALLSIFAGFPLVIYLFLAPFSDRSHIFFHWPALGYIPLFALLPDLFQSLKTQFSRIKFNTLLLLTIFLGGIGSLALILGVSTSASVTLLKLSPPGSIAYELAGWEVLHKKVHHLLKQQPDGTILVSDRYYLAAELDFLNHGSTPLFLINHPKNSEHGRAFQYRLWGRDEDSLVSKTGKRAVIVIQESDSPLRDQFDQTQQLCRLFDQLTWLDRLDLYGGEKRYQFFSGILSPDSKRNRCQAMPSIGYLGKPRKPREGNNTFNVYGWAFNGAGSVRRIELFLDDQLVGTAKLGLKERSVQQMFPESNSRGHPNSGFSFQLNMANQNKGKHQISARVISEHGVITVLRPRWFEY